MGLYQIRIQPWKQVEIYLDSINRCLNQIMERSYFELHRKFNESLYFWSSSNYKKNLYCLNKLESKELYQIQTSKKYKKPTSQLYYEGYSNNFDFDWKLVYLLPRIVTVDTKLRFFQYKILSNILFVNKMLFKLRKVESQLCSFWKAEDEIYIHLFYRSRKTSILWRQLQEFFSTALGLPIISPQSAILGFLDDA